MNAQLSAIKELLVDLEIPLQFQTAHLDSLLQAGTYAANDAIDVVGTSIALYDSHLEQQAPAMPSLTADDVYADMFLGKSNERKVPFPSPFRIAGKVRRGLCQVFPVDDAFVIDQMESFVKDINREIEKTTRRPSAFNWERKFVDHFLAAVSLLGLASNTDQDADDQSEDREGKKKISIITQQLIKKFSIPPVSGFPDRWAPGVQVIAFLVSSGLDRKYVAIPAVVESFRGECRTKKIPRYRADVEYVNFLYRRSPYLEVFARQGETHRTSEA